ncbi:MAG: hypothetical protein KAX49_16290 [Halanaerobiales bacterium]|nr:hypothetical protein [Halanaerobiales bacterium]
MKKYKSYNNEIRFGKDIEKGKYKYHTEQTLLQDIKLRDQVEGMMVKCKKDFSTYNLSKRLNEHAMQ